MRRIIITESQVRDVISSLVTESPYVRGYMFDWDDNILFMPTKIRMEKKTPQGWAGVDVSTEEFRDLRKDPNYRLINNDPLQAFNNFRDDKKYIEDIRKSLADGNYGPSYDKFIEAVNYVHPFSIITARGHSPGALRNGTEELIYHALDDDEVKKLADNIREKLKIDATEYADKMVIDYYLDLQKYNPVSSDEFIDRMKGREGGSAISAANPEQGKKMAISDFVDDVVDEVEKAIKSGENIENISFGFSDDDKGNIDIAEKLIQDELNKKYPDVKFVVYDTGDAEDIIKIKKY